MTQPTTLSPTDAARWLRKDLRRAFPGCKFSLNGSRGTGYGYYDCRWTGGPTEAEVREIVRPYVGSYFDGMTDCEVGIATAVGIAGDGTVLRSGMRSILTRRDPSEAELAAAADTLRTLWGFTGPEHSLRMAADMVARGAEVGAAIQYWPLTKD
tara:strand:- start:915 stop:1376 length:462 start_codon:yes stop_codon:yes gene_type:complete